MPSIVDKFSVKKICVDDFAFRKKYSYGTVMVDLETHRIIDILSSRDTNDVQEWLATYPNVCVVSRDGSAAYASAVTNSHPDALQISDRFHLLKGLSEAISKYIIREFPSRVEIPATTEISPEMKALYDTSNRSQRIKFAQQKRKDGLTIGEIALLLHSSPTTIRKYLEIPENKIPEDRKIARERQHQLAIEQKQKEVDEARELFNQGFSIEKIGVMMHHTANTIKAYLNPNYSVVNGHYGARIPGKLAPYENEVIQLRSQGKTYQEIHKIISNKGYTGTVARLRMFMQKERAQAKNSQALNTIVNKEFIQRKSLCQLIYHSIEEVYTLNDKQYTAVLEKYPILGQLYELIKEFYNIVFSKKADSLDGWIDKARNYDDIPELQSFIAGTCKDIDAVKNGITHQYNNGLAEGSVNKIKLIKRTMYGRNSFELLKAKILLNEKKRCQIN